MGLEEGISGVFKQPIKESEKSGFSGLLLGSAKGLTGLFTKPLSGLFDATSKVILSF